MRPEAHVGDTVGRGLAALFTIVVFVLWKLLKLVAFVGVVYAIARWAAGA